MSWFRTVSAFFPLLFFSSFLEAESSSGFVSKPSDQFLCGTSIYQSIADNAVSQYRRSLRALAATSIHPLTSSDHGNISVLEDDGTLVTQPNRFDLADRSITFSPSGASYSIASGAASFDDGGGNAQALTLSDDDSAQINLLFPFIFYGRGYTSVFVNTDGNLTFTTSDTASSERSLSRIVGGPPRIAPFFNDLNPTGSARITAEALADRAIFTWTNVGEFTSSGSRGSNTFQAILRRDGVIQFTYRTIEATTGVVAIGPGASANTRTEIVNLSDQTTAVTAEGVIGEVFAQRQEMDLGEVARAFYRTHGDQYDAIAVFADFNLVLSGNTFAYATGVRNNVRGIITSGTRTYDIGAAYGSPERLSVMLQMGNVSRYPGNPHQIFSSTFNSLGILAHEFGHRWLAFVDTTDRSLLGRDNAHWSFLQHTNGSVMEGNDIQDLGDGRFRTIGPPSRYSPLDQYLMGLRGASEVPPWFVVKDPAVFSLPPSLANRCQPDNLRVCGPFANFEFSGTRRDVTIEEVINRAGPRVPSVESAQKEFRVAFVLVTLRGQAPRTPSLQFLESLRSEFPSYFYQATDGRGAVQTDLATRATTELSTDLAINGSRHFTTAGTRPSVQVGYATVESAAGISVVRSMSGSLVKSEAAIPAALVDTSFTIYVERGDRVSTGLALLNTTSSDASIRFELSDGRQTSITLGARNQRSQFIHELFPDMVNAFAGSLTLQSTVPVGVVALRGTLNQANEFIINTVPLGTAGAIPETVAFPQIADGAGFMTELLLLNTADTRATGSIQFSFEVETDRGRNARFSYDMAPRSVWRLKTANVSPSVQTGFATMVSASGLPPVSTLVISQVAGSQLKFSAGMAGARAFTRGTIIGVRNASQRSAVAIVNPGNSTDVLLTAVRPDGTTVTSQTITISGNTNRAAFIDELAPNLPSIFEGTITFESSTPVHVISLRTTVNTAGDFLMTPMPVVAPSQQQPAEMVYFPQLVDGGNFATEYFLINTGTASGRMQFFSATGEPLPLILR